MKIEIKYWLILSTAVLLLLLPSFLNQVELIPHITWVNVEIHSGIEAMGSVLSFLIVAIIFLLFRDEHRDSDFIMIGLAFLGMGIFDLFHSFLNQGPNFVWSHIVSVFLGGAYFSFLLFPEHIKYQLSQKNTLIWTLVFWFALIIVMIVFNDNLPLLADSNGNFSFTADALNTIAGIGFFLGAYHLLKRFSRNHEIEIFFIAVIGLLQGFSRITFHWSQVWDVDWWVWHLFRLMGSFLVFIVILRLFQNILFDLKKTTAFQKTILDAMPFGVMLIGRDKKIIQINTAAQKLSGFTQHDLINSYCFETICGSDCDQCPIVDLNEKIDNTKKYILHKKGHKIPVIKTVTDINIDGEDILLEGFVDISEIEKAHHDLKNALEHLERTNEELRQFNYLASHDLQEPLRKLTNYSDLLLVQKNQQLNEKSIRFIQRISSSAAKMQSLIENLLSLSRISSDIKIEKADINKILNELQTRLKDKIYQTNTLIKWNHLPMINADIRQLKLLFFHLISNSIKFKSDKDPVIEISYTEFYDEYEFIVKDNGIGFEMEYANKIFDAFQRLHHRGTYEGNGIGLSICKKVVENHGGKITAAADLDKGTEITFTIKK